MIEKRAEELLLEKGIYINTTSGSSMRPMLRHHKDTVTVVPVTDSIKKYDVVLFKRGDQLVLHRVISKANEGFIIRGDYCIDNELVRDEQIIGILSAFTRNNHPHTVNDTGYLVYSRLIVWLNPLLKIAKRIKGILA